MRYKTLPTLRKRALNLAIAALTLTAACQTASAFMLLNGNFNGGTQSNSNAIGGVLGIPQTGTFNNWTAYSEGIAGLLLMPTVSVNTSLNPNVAQIGSLTAIDTNILPMVTDVASNYASISQITGNTFGANQLYTASVQVTMTGISATLLSQQGIGLAITATNLANTTSVVADTFGTGSPLNVTIAPFAGDTYTLSVSYLAPSTSTDRIGVRLIAGQPSGALALHVASTATFDNATLVPETHTGVLMAGALGGLFLFRRRRRE